MKEQVALLTFIENLIKEKNETSLTEEQLKNTKVALLNELNQMINTRLISLLSTPQQQELEVLLKDKVSDQELDQYFAKHIPNLEAEIASVMANFREAYLMPLEDINPLPAPVETENH